MDKYLNTFREVISLRGLSAHTLKSYCTYINAYLSFLQDVLHISPEDAFWQQMRDFLSWIQQQRNLSDRTINCCRAQLKFFTVTVYVLHKPWDNSQIPVRRFDTYLPFVPTHEDTMRFLHAVQDQKAHAILYSVCASVSHTSYRILIQ